MGVVASAREPREDRVKRHAPKKKAKEKVTRNGSKRGGDNVQRQNMEVDDNQDDHQETGQGERGLPREADAVSPGTGRLAMVG